MKELTIDELDKIGQEIKASIERGDVIDDNDVALQTVLALIFSLRAERARRVKLDLRIKELDAQIEGWCAYKRGIDEALNRGDGSYRP